MRNKILQRFGGGKLHCFTPGNQSSWCCFIIYIIHLLQFKIHMCDCDLIRFVCSSEHFAKVQFITINLTFVKATGQSNNVLHHHLASF